MVIELNRVIFTGNVARVSRFRRRTVFWLIAMLIATVPFFIYNAFLAPYSHSFSWTDSGFFITLSALLIVSFIFSTFILIPQNFEIREDGIAPPIRGYLDGMKRKERFIKFTQIDDIIIGENTLHHEILLKNGKSILLGLGGAFFLSLSVPDNQMNKMEKVLRKVRAELVKNRNNKGEIIIRKEQIEIE